jgi:hypothetical protein
MLDLDLHPKGGEGGGGMQKVNMITFHGMTENTK